MNTQAHLMFNHLFLSKKKSKVSISAVLIGAALPDMSMFLFYFWEKFVNNNTDSLIWNDLYYSTSWQNVFDIFNSVPITLILLFISWAIKSTFLKYLSLSMLLHFTFDLPFHHEDAHRHFFPITNWKFISPISYWDPKHYGLIFSGLEFLSYVCGGTWLWKTVERPGKAFVLFGGVIYLGTTVFYFSYFSYFSA